MEIKSRFLGAFVLVILFGTIVLTTAMGWWTTTASKTPATLTTGEAAGQYDPADIRGSYTLDDISRTFAIPVNVLALAFGLPEDDNAAKFQIKGLETLYIDQADAGTEVGTASVRLFVAMYAALPFDLDEDIYLPDAAVQILKTQAQLTPEQRTYLETHTVHITPP